MKPLIELILENPETRLKLIKALDVLEELRVPIAIKEIFANRLTDTLPGTSPDDQLKHFGLYARYQQGANEAVDFLFNCVNIEPDTTEPDYDYGSSEVLKKRGIDNG